MEIGITTKTSPCNLGLRCGVEGMRSRIEKRHTLLRRWDKTQNRAKGQLMNDAVALMAARPKGQRVDLRSPEDLALLPHPFVLSRAFCERKLSDLGSASGTAQAFGEEL
jgi:hypothetical protein